MSFHIFKINFCWCYSSFHVTLDPDPNPDSECNFGSSKAKKSGSGSTTLLIANTSIATVLDSIPAFSGVLKKPNKVHQIRANLTVHYSLHKCSVNEKGAGVEGG